MNGYKTLKQEEPPARTLLILYCPEWDQLEYQIGYYSPKKKIFYYPNQPNDMFSQYVEQWKILEERDENSNC